MVKTHKSSRFVLLSLEGIRDCNDIVLQIEDTATNFTDGRKCYLCEIVRDTLFNLVRNERDLISEIYTLNNEKRKLERKINSLEKKLSKEREQNETQQTYTMSADT